MAVLEAVHFGWDLDILGVGNMVRMVRGRVHGYAGGGVCRTHEAWSAAMDNTSAGEALNVGNARDGGAVLTDSLVWRK